MKRNPFAGLPLRLRLALLHASPVALAAGLLFALVTGGLFWVLHAHMELDREKEAFRVLSARRANAEQARAAAPAPVPVPEPARDNLDAFYGSLGERRYAEQQVKILFGLAAKSGLVLRQGEYKSAYDRNAGVHTYQVNLPVKGSYEAIWQFAMAALRAIPFASLDDISFRRDAIGDPTVEARLRLTFYLREGADSGSGAGAAP